jgi:hypothetical protein
VLAWTPSQKSSFYEDGSLGDCEIGWIKFSAVASSMAEKVTARFRIWLVENLFDHIKVSRIVFILLEIRSAARINSIIQAFGLVPSARWSVSKTMIETWALLVPVTDHS